MPKKRVETVYIHFIIGLAIMFLIRWMPVEMPAITPVGKQILGIFIGTLYLWSTVDPIWSSILSIFMIGTSDYAAMGGVLNASKLQNGQPGACDAYEMYAIAATVLGGTSLSGGSGAEYAASSNFMRPSVPS